VYPEIVSDFTISDADICSGETVILSSLPGASQYIWDFGDGAVQAGSNVMPHLFLNALTTPVTYSIKLTTTSFYGCIDSIRHDIVVNPMPNAEFTANPPSQVFPNATVNFTDMTNAGTWSYLWRFGDNTTSTLQNPPHTYAVPNIAGYNVWLRVTNGMCSDSINHLVYVLPTAPIASFDSIPGACAPYTVTFNNTSQYTTGAYYTWEFGDGSISHAENPTYTYLTGDIYRVKLTVTTDGGSDYMEKLLYVYDTPRAYFEVAPTKVFVDDEKVRCFNLSTGADYFIWEFGDGDTAMIRDPFHKYMAEGLYDITLHAYSNNGCYDTYILSPGVTVEPAGVIRFANVFRPSKDGPTGGSVDDLPSDQIDRLFFPPIKEQVDNYKLQIFNRAGVLIFESHDINVGWDGYYKNKLSMQGVYVWYVEGKYANGKPFKKTGDITLLH
jgi:PKD repeat protein